MQKNRFLAPLLALVGALALTVPTMAQPPQNAAPEMSLQPSSTPSGETAPAQSGSAMMAAPATLYVYLTSPYGDPIVGGPSSEFVFSSQSGQADAGVLTITCEATISPDTPENRASVANRIRFKVDPIGDSHTSSEFTLVRWDNPWYLYANGASRDGKGVYDANTGTFKATVSFIGLPKDNKDFGLKNVKVQLMGTDKTTLLKEDSTQIEVFFGKTAINHPGRSFSATQQDFGTSTDGRIFERSPNWFYYWIQALESDNNSNESSVYARYIGGLNINNGVAGVSPSGAYYADDYDGQYRRTIVTNEAGFLLGDPDYDGPKTETTGIDSFRSVLIHEKYHAIQQSLKWTNLAFGLSLQPSNNVSSSTWSFSLRPGDVATPAGRRWNHRTYDEDFDDVYTPDDRNPTVPGQGGIGGPGGLGNADIEDPAYNSEPGQEHAFARKDWGAPGKNYRGIDNAND